MTDEDFDELDRLVQAWLKSVKRRMDELPAALVPAIDCTTMPFHLPDEK